MSIMIAVPDGHSGSLYHCHVPLRSHMVARDVSRCLHQPNVQDNQLSAVFGSLILANDTSLYCCRIHRYIAQHMNIHNPEDFALFRITERKGANSALMPFSPNSPMFQTAS